MIDTSAPGLNPPAGRIGLLAYAAGPAAVRDVLVDGRWVVRDGVLTTASRSDLAAAAAQSQRRVLAAAGLRGDYLALPDGWRVEA